ncbi:D-alanyl-D-alanine carboxypeptidase [Kitasatospora sp. MMS16-BH015]|uniref:D-alanyl-D-alanine carboxypeptidase n=1 Tax=Kitasatospora sp. MMS16-BH015 TaxID=2018025 RepID=UPI000CA3D220|nr:D-alanyl-D-alanine carboxypeptidase [Kitasatospora sp. MMS16-BH015]AUG79255.1 D-alanyl-D-alanine carboxypeptidase [Kitasatospora sp. MMS16-BH015]
MGESPDSVRRDGEGDTPTPEEGRPNSTVTLRVREVDNKTTTLRLPADNRTTAIRLPADPVVAAAEPAADAAAKAGKPAAPSAKAGEPAAKAGEPAAPSADAGKSAAKPGKPAADADQPEAVEPAAESAEVAVEHAGPERASAEQAGAEAEQPEPEAESARAVDTGVGAETKMLRLPAKPKEPAAEGATAGGSAAPGAAAAESAPEVPAVDTGVGAETKMLRLPAKPKEPAAGSAADGSAPEAPVADAGVSAETKMLRLPPKPASAAASAGSAAAGSAAATSAAVGAPSSRPSAAEAAEGVEPGGVDPRLAIRDSRGLAGAELKGAAKAPAGAPVGGTVPEPPVEPEPVPEPGPEPEPAPVPTPVPAPKPVPVPQPVPPLPVPDPAPLPAPETTSEAMEVLAALSARPVSPLRRAVKRFTIWTVFLGFVLGLVVAGQLLRPLPDPKTKLSLADSFTFAGDQPALPWPGKGQAVAEVVGVGSLGSSGTETPAPIASVTKVMNALLILQDHPLKKGESGPKLTVDKQAAQESSDADQSRVTLTEGQQLTEYEALEMLMLPSANNVARLLARWDAGSEQAFVKKMNDQAAKLGMTNTTYADPAGYDNNTKSTAKDQLKLAELAMQNEIFRQVVATPDTTFNGQRVYNTNYLLSAKNGVIGVKTGSSTPAGSCLMWAAVKEIGGVKRLILGVTLGQPATTSDNILKAAQTVSQKIITAAQNGLTGQTLAKQGQVVGYVDNGLGGKTSVVAAQDLTVAGWPGITAKVTLDKAKLGHTVKSGTQVGTVSAGEGDGKVEVPVTLQGDLNPPSIMSRLLRLL